MQWHTLIIITADHGFILGDESLETGRGTKLECVERRYAFGSERAGENLVSVALSQLNYSSLEEENLSSREKENFFIFERTTHLLTNQSRTGFYHGGNTLQERLVPVISFALTKELPDNSGSFELTIQKKPDVLGFHRIGFLPVSKSPGFFSIPHVDVQLLSDKDVLVEIGDIVGAQRKGGILTLPLNRESEIYFKLSNGACSKAQIYFKATQQRAVLINSEYFEYFEVENYKVNTEQANSKSKARSVSLSSTKYPETIPEEFHAALAHLEKHGSLTEKFLVNTLGNDSSAARKGRRFANKIGEWLKELPFDVYIVQTPEGKEYRIK